MMQTIRARKGFFAVNSKKGFVKNAFTLVLLAQSLTLAFLIWNGKSIRYIADRYQPSNAENFNLRISVITKRRPKPLKRLLDSLLAAEYFGKAIPLDIYIDSEEYVETIYYLQTLEWPHGTKTLHYRIAPAGLVNAIAESWYPASDDEYAILLEDDLEVSPFFMHWLHFGLVNVERSPSIVGISLYTPRVTELFAPTGPYLPQPFNSSSVMETLTGDPTSPFRQQLPCSWGVVYFPKFWQEFHAYMTLRLLPGQQNMTFDIPRSRSVGWRASWKKFMIELLWAKGYSLLYPNFANQTSFCTNHLEPGEHISANDTDHRALDYTVPLMQSLDEVEQRILGSRFETKDLPLLNIFGQPYRTLKSLEEELKMLGDGDSKNEKSDCDPNTMAVFCQRFNRDAHREMQNHNLAMTVMIVYNHSTAGQISLINHLRHFTGSNLVDKILIIWNNTAVASPQPIEINEILVDFIVPTCRSINNKYLPDLRVSSGAVLIVENDDSTLDLHDLNDLFQIWNSNSNKVVGLHPIRLDGMSAMSGYVAVDGKFSLMKSSYLYEYICGSGSVALDQVYNSEDAALALGLMVMKLLKSPGAIVMVPMKGQKNTGSGTKIQQGLLKAFNLTMSRLLLETAFLKPNGTRDIYISN